MSWSNINRLLLVATFLIVTISPVGYFQLRRTLKDWAYSAPLEPKVPDIQPTKTNQNQRVLSEEEIASLATIRLRRMNPPAPIPTPPPVAIAPPTPTIFPFNGLLLGTFVELDDKNNFALLQLPDGRRVLVGKSETIPNFVPEVIVEEIKSSEVTLKQGEQIHHLSIPTE